MTITITPPPAPPQITVTTATPDSVTVGAPSTPPSIDVEAGGNMPTLPDGYAFLIAPDGEYLIG